MFKKIWVIVIAVLSMTYLSLGYANNANPAMDWVNVSGNLPVSYTGKIVLTEFNNKLYAAGNDGKMFCSAHPFVSVYNGDNRNPKWTSVSSNAPFANNDCGYVYALTVCNNTLYASGLEPGTNNRVFAYNGDDNNPRWTPIDTSGIPSLANVEQLVRVNDKMYARTSRDDIYAYNEKNQSWSRVNDDKWAIATITTFNNKLYAIARGAEPNNLVIVYNGNDNAPSWALANVGLPTSFTANTLIAFNNTLFAGGDIQYTSGGVAYAYNGNDKAPNWSDISRGLSPNSYIWSFTVSNNTLYALEISNFRKPELRTLAYNGNNSNPQWIPADGGTLLEKEGYSKGEWDYAPAQLALTDFHNALYITGFHNYVHRVHTYLYALLPVLEEIKR